MGFLEKVDDFLIDNFFQKIVDWVMMTFGKSHWWLATIALWICIICYTSLAIREYQIDGSLVTFGLLIIVSPSILIHLHRCKKQDERIKWGPNPERHSPILSHFRVMVFLVFSFVETRSFISHVFTGFDLDYYVNLGIGLSLNSVFYFMACSLPPPRFKKAHSKLASQTV
jgi:hypothetical protein